MVSQPGRRPNWLLRGLLFVSIGVHAVLLVHIASLYGSRALSIIELTLRDVSKPPEREIPRPPPRPPAPAVAGVVREVVVAKAPVPVPDPVRAVRVDPPGLAAPAPVPIALPKIIRDPGPEIERWVPEGRDLNGTDPNAPRAYLNMVRLRIEHHKKYPESARRRNIEGRAKVRFVIRPDGSVGEVQVVVSAGNPSLDRAAEEAVRAASPFPTPPADLFKGAIPMELTIVFQLT